MGRAPVETTATTSHGLTVTVDLVATRLGTTVTVGWGGVRVSAEGTGGEDPVTTLAGALDRLDTIVTGAQRRCALKGDTDDD